MFLHICTTTTIHSDKLLSLWQNSGGADKHSFETHVFHFSDILAQSHNKPYLEHLKLLITQGRAQKQLVIIQMDNYSQLDELKDKELLSIIRDHTERIPLN